MLKISRCTEFELLNTRTPSSGTIAQEIHSTLTQSSHILSDSRLGFLKYSESKMA